MSTTTRVTTEIRDHILLIGLNRPDKLNAADEQMLHELSLAYGQLDTDPNLRVGVVFAYGDHFTAGLDLNDVGPKLAAGKLQMVPEGGLDPWGMSTKQVSKPVVMATKGTCFTLGVELALASDVVIAASDSRFAQLEVARGIMPFGGGTIRFPEVAGHANAMRYLLTGDSFGADDALRWPVARGRDFRVAPGKNTQCKCRKAQAVKANVPPMLRLIIKNIPPIHAEGISPQKIHARTVQKRPLMRCEVTTKKAK